VTITEAPPCAAKRLTAATLRRLEQARAVVGPAVATIKRTLLCGKVGLPHAQLGVGLVFEFDTTDKRCVHHGRDVVEPVRYLASVSGSLLLSTHVQMRNLAPYSPDGRPGWWLHTEDGWVDLLDAIAADEDFLDRMVEDTHGWANWGDGFKRLGKHYVVTPAEGHYAVQRRGLHLAMRLYVEAN